MARSLFSGKMLILLFLTIPGDTALIFLNG